MAKKKVSQLKILMDRNGVTVDDLSQILHLSSSTIKAWVSGSKEPYEAVLDQLCEVLACTRDDLKKPVTDDPTSSIPADKEKNESESESDSPEKPDSKSASAITAEPKIPKVKKTLTSSKEPGSEDPKPSSPDQIKVRVKKNTMKEKMSPTTDEKPAAKPVGLAKRFLYEKVRLSESSSALLRSLDPAKVLKGKGDMTKTQLDNWAKSLEEYFATQTKQITAIISSLVDEAAEPKGIVIERKKLAELMEVAKTASDADIDLVIEMLRRLNP
ncbi:MAG: helix-turn-helix transcriptional regulator [Lachnospiraceae bacterium]|nr:helix-turn-helix transcriptional regulator [Lachnospiraceae bacterium]